MTENQIHEILGRVKMLGIVVLDPQAEDADVFRDFSGELFEILEEFIVSYAEHIPDGEALMKFLTDTLRLIMRCIELKKKTEALMNNDD